MLNIYLIVIGLVSLFQLWCIFWLIKDYMRLRGTFEGMVEQLDKLVRKYDVSIKVEDKK